MAQIAMIEGRYEEAETYLLGALANVGIYYRPRGFDHLSYIADLAENRALADDFEGAQAYLDQAQTVIDQFHGEEGVWHPKLVMAEALLVAKRDGAEAGEAYLRESGMTSQIVSRSLIGSFGWERLGTLGVNTAAL
ncbi:hypothetical protein [Ponticaulis sp.]|uniref:hypothetical protein n=1 Tax=Ponticaulis sp. TaxID=2020902 RepID=UPI000B684377|nr:hypothetical protein [Ponticaulis sp.]MAI91217.1 hypothetical protein [Ponticaulis sp.]OUX98530.1 MAG: hypothetical protein CBB65_12285 [Hyphomonadaceae bacterium TMED5]